MGHLTRNPEMRYATSGTEIVNFGMAINHGWKSKDGEDKSEVCFVEITMFGKRAEAINKHFVKGNPIFIEGRLQFQQWEAKDGGKRSMIKVIADNFQFVGQRQDKGDSRPDIKDEEIPF